MDVRSPGVNPWDIQLSQSGLALKAGETYSVTFWARSETNSPITAAIINTSNFNLYASETFMLTSTWTQYNFKFAAPADAVGSFNIDMGGHKGKYYFDDFRLNISGSGGE